MNVSLFFSAQGQKVQLNLDLDTPHPHPVYMHFILYKICFLTSQQHSHAEKVASLCRMLTFAANLSAELIVKFAYSALEGEGGSGTGGGG